MKLEKVKIKLDKVNRFFAYLESNKELVSRVDHDIFLEAIRNLYDVCFDDVSENQEVLSVTKDENISPDTKEGILVDEKNKNIGKPVKQNVLSEEIKSSNNTKTVSDIVESDNMPDHIYSNKVIGEKVVKEKTTVEKSLPEKFNNDFDELFVFKAAADLSQKLSDAPIKDLNKALGLNEKFLYINELFSGDVDKFQSSIKILNEGNSFLDARVHIESALIEQHQWMKKTKKPVAKEFVKLVRRRYL